MTQVKLDAELRSKLAGFRESIELVDDVGNVVGQVLRLDSARPWEPPLDDEERSKAPAVTYSSEELRALLRKE